uniref:CHK domain-containing protein n=1 Tax=Panagrellus redivivus TaxID=6233 RepID=A0A7E4WDC4_PANRE
MVAADGGSIVINGGGEAHDYEKLKNGHVSFEHGKKLHDTGFSAGWLVETLRERDEEFGNICDGRDVLEVTCEYISEGKGFASLVLRCLIHFDDNSDPYSTVLKVPGTDVCKKASKSFETDVFQVADDIIKKIRSFHDFECHFYTDLAPILDIPVPIVHYSQPWTPFQTEGCILMEDLTKRGTTLSFFTSWNLAQTMEVVRHLAHMHKQVLCLPVTDEWQRKLVGNENGFFGTQRVISNSIGPFQGLCRRFGYEIDHLLSKLNKFLISADEVIAMINGAHAELNMPAVIVHGDLWSNNILWTIDENQMPTDSVAAFIDFQLMHAGSATADIAGAVALCVDGATRREAESDVILGQYFEILSTELASEGKDMPFTMDQLRRAYQLDFLQQATQLVVMTVVASSGGKPVSDADLNTAILRAVNVLEDTLHLLEGPLKHIGDKFIC